MINYINCSNADIEKVYNAFRVGFSDYRIKLEMDMDTFIKRFLHYNIFKIIIELSKIQYLTLRLD